MPNNRNTDNVVEHSWLDAEDWEIALQPYDANPDAALLLSVNLSQLRNHITESTAINEAMAELDRAIEVLFLHSQFHEVSYLLFRQMADGKLSFEHQTMLKTSGIKF